MKQTNKLKLSLSQKVGCTADVVTQSGAVSASGLSCGTRLVDFLPPWESIGWDVVVQPGPVLSQVAYFVACSRSEHSFACCACLQGFYLPIVCLPGSFNFIFPKCLQSSTVECVLSSAVNQTVYLSSEQILFRPFVSTLCYDPSRLTA